MAPAMATVSSPSSFATLSTIQIILAILIPLISLVIIIFSVLVYRRLKQSTIDNEQPILPITTTGPLFNQADVNNTIPVPPQAIQDIFIPAIGAPEVDVTDHNESFRVYSVYSAYIDSYDDISTSHSSISFEAVDISDSLPPSSPEDEFFDIDLGVPGVEALEMDITIQNHERQLDNAYVAYLYRNDDNRESSDPADVAGSRPLPPLSPPSSTSVANDTFAPFSYGTILDANNFERTKLPFSIPEEDKEDLDECQLPAVPLQLDDGDVEFTALIIELPASPPSPIPDSLSSIYSEYSFFGDDEESFHLSLILGKQNSQDVSGEIVQDSGVAFNDPVEMSSNDEAAACLQSIVAQHVPLEYEDGLPQVPLLSTSNTLPLKKNDISSTKPLRIVKCSSSTSIESLMEELMPPIPFLSTSTLPLNIKKKDALWRSVSAPVDLQQIKPPNIVRRSSSTSIKSLMEELMVPMKPLASGEQSDSLAACTFQLPSMKPLSILKSSSSAPSSFVVVGKQKDVMLEGTQPLKIIRRSSSLGAVMEGKKRLNVTKRSGSSSGSLTSVAGRGVEDGAKVLNILKRSGSSCNSLTSVDGSGMAEVTRPLHIMKRTGSSVSLLSSIGESGAMDIVKGLNLNTVESVKEEGIVARNIKPTLDDLMIVSEYENEKEFFAGSGSFNISVNEAKEVVTTLGSGFILESPRTYSSRRLNPDPFDTPPPQPLSANWSNSYIDEHPDSLSSHNARKYSHNANAAPSTFRPPTSSSSRAPPFSLEPFYPGKSEGSPSDSLVSLPGLSGYHGLVSSSTSSCSGAGQALSSPYSPPLRFRVGTDAYVSLMRVELDLPSSADTHESGFGSKSSSSLYTVQLSTSSVPSLRGMEIEMPSAPTPSRGRFVDSSISPLLPAFDSMVWLGAGAHQSPISPSHSSFSIRARSRTAGSASPKVYPYRPSAPTPDRARRGHRQSRSCGSFVTSSSSGLRGSCSLGSGVVHDVRSTPSGSMRSHCSKSARPSAPTPSRMRSSPSSSCCSVRFTRSPPPRPCPPTPSRMRSLNSNHSSPAFSAHRRRQSPAVTFSPFRLPPSQTMHEFRNRRVSLIGHGSRSSRGYLHMTLPDVISTSIFKHDSVPVIAGPRDIFWTPDSRAMFKSDNALLGHPSLPPSDTKPPVIQCSHDSVSASPNSLIDQLSNEILAGFSRSLHIDTSSSCPTLGLNSANEISLPTHHSSVLANGSYSLPSLATAHLRSSPAPTSSLTNEIHYSLYLDLDHRRLPLETLARVLSQERSSTFTSRSLPCSPSRYTSISAPGTPISRFLSEFQPSNSFNSPPPRPCAPTGDISDGSPRYLEPLCGTPSSTTSPTVPFSPPDSRPTSFELRPESVLSVDDELMFRYHAERRRDKAYPIHVYLMALLLWRLAKGERVTPNYTAVDALAVLEGRGHDSKRIRGEQKRTQLIHLEDGRRAVRYHTRKLWENGIMEGITDGFEEEQGEMAGPDEEEPDWEELQEYMEEMYGTGCADDDASSISSSECVSEGELRESQYVEEMLEREREVDDAVSSSSSEDISECEQSDCQSVESVEGPFYDDIDSNGFSMMKAVEGIMKAQPPHPTWMPPQDPNEFIQDHKRRFWRRDMDVLGKNEMVLHAFDRIPNMSLSL